MKQNRTATILISAITLFVGVMAGFFIGTSQKAEKTVPQPVFGEVVLTSASLHQLQVQSWCSGRCTVRRLDQPNVGMVIIETAEPVKFTIPADLNQAEPKEDLQLSYVVFDSEGRIRFAIVEEDTVLTDVTKAVFILSRVYSAP